MKVKVWSRKQHASTQLTTYERRNKVVVSESDNNRGYLTPVFVTLLAPTPINNNSKWRMLVVE